MLDAKSSNEPGRWKTSRVPYLRGIMETFTDPEVEETVFVKPTQVGGTECLLNILGYIGCEDESPTLVVYPTEKDAEHISKNRIQPMLTACEELAAKYDEKNSKLLELQIGGMYIALSGANSPSGLASKPIRFLLLDEVDKFPPRAGKEADPIALARERTRTYSYNRKIFITSTPTYKTGAVWEEFMACETQYHYYVPCPHCGEYQRLRFRQIKYDSTPKNDSDKADTAYYECAHCRSKIIDADKADMLAAGEWRADKSGSRRKVGFHLNAIYSPWVRFRDVVHEWLITKKDPDTQQNFINSWLAEPWEQVSSTADGDKVLANQSRYTRGVVPDGTRMITGGVDKQKDCYYYTIRAWGENRRSWNIDHGQVATEHELVPLFDRTYHDEKGNSYFVDFVLVDSGDDTDTVYDFCYLHQGLFAPLKGSSNPIPSRYRLSKIEKAESMAKGMQLIICDGSYYKDMIYRRMNRKDGNGWYVYDGCDKEYAQQVTAEHKVTERIAGRSIQVWRPKASGIDNHYLDCEVYAACAADVMGAFDLLAETPAAETAETPPVQTMQPAAQSTAQEPAPEPQEEYIQEDWIREGNSWL